MGALASTGEFQGLSKALGDIADPHERPRAVAAGAENRDVSWIIFIFTESFLKNLRQKYPKLIRSLSIRLIEIKLFKIRTFKCLYRRFG